MLSKQKSEGLFLDIGSNIGYFSIVASPLYREIHAIEASPSIYQRLDSQINHNDIKNIKTYNVAVGEREGHIDFYKDKNQSGASSTIKSDSNEFEARVPIAPLTEILGDIDWNDISFIKIDVEGFEWAVLNSLFSIYHELKEDIEIFVEYDPNREGEWKTIQQFIDVGCHAYILQGPYDRQDYIDKQRLPVLEKIKTSPEMFCDIIIKR